MPDYSQFHLDTGEFTPTYTGSPLEIVTETNKALQDRHYQNINDLSKTQIALSNMAATLGSTASTELQNKATEIQTTLDEMAKTGAENSTAKVNHLTRKFLGDVGLQKALKHAEAYHKDVATAAEIEAKTGKKGLIKMTQDKYNSMSLADMQEGYTPSATGQHNLQEAMKESIEQVKPNEWATIFGDSKKAEDFVKANYDSKIEMLQGFITSIDKSTNKDKLTDPQFRQKLHNLFETTAAYNQGVDYGVYGQNEVESAVNMHKKFDEFLDTAIFNHEKVDKNVNPVFMEGVRQAASRAVTPTMLVDNATNSIAGYDIKLPDVKDLEQTLADKKLQLANQAGRNEDTSQTQAEITELENTLSSTYTPVEKQIDMEQAWKDYQQHLKSEPDDKNDLYFDESKRMHQLPRTQSEFMNFIRSGKYATTQSTTSPNPTSKKGTYLNALRNQYHSLRNTILENTKLASSAKVLGVTKENNPAAYDIEQVGKKLLGSEFLNTLSSSPGKETQWSLNSITKELKDAKVIDEKTKITRDNIDLQVLDKPIGGYYSFSITPEVETIDGRPAGSYIVHIKDQAEAQKLAVQTANTLSPNNPNHLLRKGYAYYNLPKANIQSIADNKEKIVSGYGMPEIKITPVDINTGEAGVGTRDPKTGRNTAWKVQYYTKNKGFVDLDSTNADRVYQSEEEVATALGGFVAALRGEYNN